MNVLEISNIRSYSYLDKMSKLLNQLLANPYNNNLARYVLVELSIYKSREVDRITYEDSIVTNKVIDLLYSLSNHTILGHPKTVTDTLVRIVTKAKEFCFDCNKYLKFVKGLLL